MVNMQTEKFLTVLIVEDEPDECDAFLQYIESHGSNIQIVGIVNNANEALQYVKDTLPDVIILDLELHKGSGNGITFLTTLKSSRVSFTPFILITTNNVSRITHDKVRQLGADFIMLKCQNDYSAKSVIDFILSMKDIIFDSQRKHQIVTVATQSPDTKKKSLEKRVLAETNKIGISPKVTGRKYLIDCILFIIAGNNNYIKEVAKKYQKTDASVERAMQNAINGAWRTGDIEDLQKYYTARISSEKGVPTITEFLYYFAEKIKIEY